jgi:hypothetical protein
MRRGVREILLVLVLSCTTWRVSAAASDDAEGLIQQGLALRRSGKNFEALKFFQRALGLAPTPRSNAQLGLAEQALGHWVESEQHLGTALAADTDGWIRKNRAILEASLSTVRSHVGLVEVTGEPAGASVRVNGNVVGTLPLTEPIRANEGYLEVDLQAPGWLPAHRTLTVKPAQSQRLFVRLDASGSPPPIAADAPPPAVARGEADSHTSRTSPQQISRPPERADSGRTLRGIGMGAAALGVLGVAGGIWMSVRVASLKRDVEAGNNDPQLQTDGHRAEKLQWVGYGVGAGALAAGGILYYLGMQRENAVTLVPLPRGALALVHWRM